jgi:hypothetical protein
MCKNQRMHLGNRLVIAVHLSIQAKAVPLHAMEALGGRRYSSYSLLTLALDGVSSQHHAPAML